MERTTEYSQLDVQFLERWSPRSFLNDPLSEEEIGTVLEAARWSPSCFNEQPWLFVYAQGDQLPAFQSVLMEMNQKWANQAPLLVIVFTRINFERNGKPNEQAEFDAGSAWMALALQAHKLGLVTHAMAGFEEDKAYEIAKVDRNQYKVMCVVAVGRQGPKEQLASDFQEREAPSDRKPLSEVSHEGPF